MDKNGFIIRDYYGKNFIGLPAHIWELHSNEGELLYRLCDVLGEDQSEHIAAPREFKRRCEALMDRISAEGK